MLEQIALAAVGIYLAPTIFMNTIGPFIIWKTQKIPAIVSFNGVNEDEFLSNRNEDFLNYDNSLKLQGFEYIGSSTLDGSHTNTYFSLYTNDNLSLAATVVTITSAVQGVKELTYIELSQLYADGTMLDVSNSHTPGAYPKLDLKIAVQYPEINEVSELIRIISILKEKLKNTANPISYKKNLVFKPVEDFLKRESDELVTKGVCKNSIDANGKRSLTLKGAIILTYKSVKPGKQIVAYLNGRKARALLKSA